LQQIEIQQILDAVTVEVGKNKRLIRNHKEATYAVLPEPDDVADAAMKNTSL